MDEGTVLPCICGDRATKTSTCMRCDVPPSEADVVGIMGIRHCTETRELRWDKQKLDGETRMARGDVYAVARLTTYTRR